jgi:phosphoglycerol transferase MdoB-like AlkP superfamily enzyme
MERAKRIAIVFAVLLTGAVVVSLVAGFEQLILHPFALIGSIALAALVSLIILAVALVPSRRYTGWAKSLTGPNGRWFFLLLILLWSGGMAFLASLGMGPQQNGSPAFVGMLAGIFIFMGFIWSVIGE